VVTDPLSTLVSFGWTTREYARCRSGKLMSLLRCKSLSLAYQYPGCPIIAALARYGLRVTKSYAVNHLTERKGISMWDREQLREALANPSCCDIPVGENTRLLVERLYRIPMQVQRDFEDYLDSLHSLTPLDLGVLDQYCHPSWFDYCSSYGIKSRVSDPLLESPAKLWPPLYSREW